MKNKGKDVSLQAVINNISDEWPITENEKSFNKENKNKIIKHSNKFLRKKNKKENKRKLNSLDELSRKFMKCVYEENSSIINLKKVLEKMEVKKRRIYDITNVLEGKWILFYINIIIFLGIGVIQKDKKNQIQIKPEFYELYENNNNNIIELKEKENIRDKENLNNNKAQRILKMRIIDSEIEKVNLLIKKTNQKLLKFQTINDEDKNNNIYLTNKDIYDIYHSNREQNEKSSIIGIKSKKEKKTESIIVNERAKSNEKKKNGIDLKNNNCNSDYLSQYSFSNKLFVVSNNTDQIELLDIERKDEKKELEKYKEKENEFFWNKHIISNNENNLWLNRNNNQERKEDSFSNISSLDKDNSNSDDFNNIYFPNS